MKQSSSCWELQILGGISFENMCEGHSVTALSPLNSSRRRPAGRCQGTATGSSLPKIRAANHSYRRPAFHSLPRLFHFGLDPSQCNKGRCPFILLLSLFSKYFLKCSGSSRRSLRVPMLNLSIHGHAKALLSALFSDVNPHSQDLGLCPWFS